MYLIAEGNRIAVRRMEENDSDLRLYLKWMTDPETMKYWDGMTEQYDYNRVFQTYKENFEEEVTMCMIEYDREPIGFCQFCVLNAEYYEVPKSEYDRFVKESELVYGIDIFLGEVKYRNQGIGSASLKLVVQALFTDYNADVIMIDPKVHNTRAIQCYRKSGFTDYFTVPHRELQDGIYHDSLIMGIRR